jgi:amino acid transporter
MMTARERAMRNNVYAMLCIFTVAGSFGLGILLATMLFSGGWVVIPVVPLVLVGWAWFVARVWKFFTTRMKETP